MAPKGMPDRIDSNIELLRKLDNDDDFFSYIAPYRVSPQIEG